MLMTSEILNLWKVQVVYTIGLHVLAYPNKVGWSGQIHFMN